MTLNGQVEYQSNILVDGVQLVKDSKEEHAYYYIPPFPRLVENKNKIKEFALWKYMGRDTLNGGIVHFLIDFKLSENEQLDLEQKLKIQLPNAHLKGMVPLKEKKGEGFRLISSIVSNKNGFSKKVIQSGHAPIQESGEVAIAANLTQTGTTLLWESLKKPTSDISIGINCYYTARIQSYNANISASLKKIYNSFKEEVRDKISKDDINDKVKNLIDSKVIKIEINNRDADLKINKNLDDVVSIITEQIMDLIFIPLSQNNNTANFSYILTPKVQRDSFHFNLNRSKTIDVPIITANNISLFKDIDEIEEIESNYFHVINLKNPSFKKFTSFFQIDKEYLPAFEQSLNYCLVYCRKEYSNGQIKEEKIEFNTKSLKEGNIKPFVFNRLEEKGSWTKFKYKIDWGVKGLSIPTQEPHDSIGWLVSSNSINIIKPPLKKKKIQIAASRNQFLKNEIYSCLLIFKGKLGGIEQDLLELELKDTDAKSIEEVNVFCDVNTPIKVWKNWFGVNGEFIEEDEILGKDFLIINIPNKTKLK